MAGLPFNPPGFTTLGNTNTRGAIISAEHEETCPLAGISFTLPPVDISMFDIAQDRKKVRNLITSLAGENGCFCGIDIPNTQVLITRINNSGAPAQAVPFILQGTTPWRTYVSNTGQQLGATETIEQMDDVDYGSLEASKHAPTPAAHAAPTRPNTPGQTQLPAPRMDSQSPPLTLPAVPLIFQSRFGQQAAANPKPPPAVPFSPRTANTTTLATRNQGQEELMAHINALISKTSGQVSILSGRMDRLFEVTDSGFTNNDILFKEQMSRITDLNKQVNELKQVIRNLQRPAPVPAIPNRAPVNLPVRPTAPTAADKGKGIAMPSPSPAPAPAPKPFRATQTLKPTTATHIPSQGRAPAPTPL